MIPPISVVLPVFSAVGTLRRAVHAVRCQSAPPIEILIVLNGSDEATREAAGDAMREDARVRILEMPAPNLSAALNAALREARADLVARMDADDECAPERFALQAKFLRDHHRVAVVGTAYERRLADGTRCGVVRPPTTPEDIRWRLLLGNTMCHGSTMMRRDVVLSENGYNESCMKAQDFELWLRLSARHDLANLPEVLYTYTVRETASVGVPSASQAALVAERLLAAWSELPGRSASDEHRSEIMRAMADSQLGGTQTAGALSRIEALLRGEPPSRESIMAAMFVESMARGTQSAVDDACKRSRLREVGRHLRACGVRRVWLWGAGGHTEWLLDYRADLGVEIIGVADDARAGQTRYGFEIVQPESLPARAHVLLSSDRHEDEMWRRSGPLRSRGVAVHRLYGDTLQDELEQSSPLQEGASARVA